MAMSVFPAFIEPIFASTYLQAISREVSLGAVTFERNQKELMDISANGHFS